MCYHRTPSECTHLFRGKTEKGSFYIHSQPSAYSKESKFAGFIKDLCSSLGVVFVLIVVNSLAFLLRVFLPFIRKVRLLLCYQLHNTPKQIYTFIGKYQLGNIFQFLIFFLLQLTQYFLRIFCNIFSRFLLEVKCVHFLLFLDVYSFL